jgi:hypothetical protein
VRADQQELDFPRAWGEMSVSGAGALATRCGGRCGRPHWGYVIRGAVRVAYPDHDEVISAGDAYYVAPGHLDIRLDEAELVDFGPPPPGGPTARHDTRRTNPEEQTCNEPDAPPDSYSSRSSRS